MLNEFLALTLGTRTVLQYIQVFNHLCQYAGQHADTDAKKKDNFRRGLNTKLKGHLNLVRPNSFNELVNMAITQDDCITAHRAEKKREAPTGPSGAQPPRYRSVENTTPKAPLKNATSGRWIFRPPQQQGVTRFSMPQQQQQQQQQSNPRTNDQHFNRWNNYNRCFNCGDTSHFAKNCPQPKKSFSGQNSNQNSNQSKGKKQVVQVKQGWVNFTTLDELPRDAPIMMGTFSILPKPAVTLLTSGVTCSFNSTRFWTQKKA